jgi:hypothetical protein
VPTLEDFLKEYINNVGYVDWVCLAPDTVWKTTQNMVMSRLCKKQISALLMEQQLHTGIYKKKFFVTLKFALT